MRLSFQKTVTLAIAAPLALAACAETQLAVHSAKELAGTVTKPDPKTKGYYKVGKPYRIKNTWYYPAEDFDGDGRRDIWKNEGDVFASIANYLAKHGWNDNLTWGRKVMVPSSLIASLGKPTRRAAPGCRARTSERQKLSEWQALGLRRADGSDLPTADLSAALVLPDGPKGEAYIVYRNYAAIMAYNCAHLYAVTVGTLADRIGSVK